MSSDLGRPRPDPPTHAEALAGSEQDLAAARLSLAEASERLARARRHGRKPDRLLLAWNLARNEVEHRSHQVEWWSRLLAAHPERADEPILPIVDRAEFRGEERFLAPPAPAREHAGPDRPEGVGPRDQARRAARA